jgi:hypothetical protein
MTQLIMSGELSHTCVHNILGLTEASNTIKCCCHIGGFRSLCHSPQSHSILNAVIYSSVCSEYSASAISDSCLQCFLVCTTVIDWMRCYRVLLVAEPVEQVAEHVEKLVCTKVCTPEEVVPVIPL